ncbi:MAG: ribosome maturation factor RimP [Actinomycetota bacterium]|nr:ribosome maturation factor RimP [Actinomycetota bacterium]
MTSLQADIERRLANSEPDVEVLLAEVVGGRCLRVFIDHPEGVTLGLCERVTVLLGDLRERYSLEVSSPGSERPLTKPEHFRRFVGRRARVRTRHPRPQGVSREQCSDVAKPADRSSGGRAATPQTSPTDAPRSFTGELVGASEEEVTLVAEGFMIAIPYSEIHRSNLLEE